MHLVEDSSAQELARGQAQGQGQVLALARDAASLPQMPSRPCGIV